MRCSPPDSVPATCVRRSPSRGNSAYASSSAARTPARPAAAPERQLEVLLDRERREHRTALGRVHDRRAARSWYGRWPGDVVRRRSSTWPAVGAIEPEHTRAIVVLPEPFEPSSASTPPAAPARTRRRRSRGTARTPASTSRSSSSGGARRGRGRRRPSDEVPEVGLAHRVVGEHRRRSGPTRSACRSRARRRARRGCGRARRRARRAGSRSPARAAPCAAFAPSAAVSCAVESRRRLVEQHELRLGHQRAPDLDQPADAEAQRLDRAVGDRRRARAGRASPARAAFSSAVGRPQEQHVLPQRAAARCGRGRRRGSARAASCPTNSSMRWNVRPIPSRARRCVGTRVRSRPSNVTVPPSGLRMPSRQLKNVVLPAPFGPISPTISPASTSRLDVVERGDARERLRDALGVEQAHDPTPGRRGDDSARRVGSGGAGVGLALAA